jgi:hypothetical protein
MLSSKEVDILESRTIKIAIILGLIVSIAIIGVEIYICDILGDIVREIMPKFREWLNAGIKIG